MFSKLRAIIMFSQVTRIVPIVIALFLGEFAIGSDTQPPTLVDLEITPSIVDVEQEDAVLDVNLSYSDDLSGLDWGQFRIISPSSVFIDLVVLGEDKVVEGDDLNGKYNFSIILPKYSEEGELRYDLKIRDKVGNWLNLTYSDLVDLNLGGKVSVTNDDADLLAPEITEIKANPNIIDVNRVGASVTFDLTFSDLKSGIDRGQFRIRSPTEQFITLATLGPDKLVEGDVNGGVLRVSLDVPAFTPSGLLYFDYQLTDKVGNTLRGDNSLWEASVALDIDSDSDGVGDNSDAFPNNALYAGSIDLDGNEDYDALTDGLLLLRGMFGLDGSALVTGTIASDATYTESVDIESRIATLGDLADIDGNGEIDALTDGLLTLRYLFGLQGDTLIDGVVAGDATRTTAEEIEAHLETLMPGL